MQHAQVTGEFVHDRTEVARKKCMARVEAGADIGFADRAEQEKHVTHMSEHQVRQHVFQQQREAQIAAVRGNEVERLRGAAHPVIPFFGRRLAFAFRAGMQNDIARMQRRRRITGGKHLAHGFGAQQRIGRRNVDALGERRVKRIGFDAKRLHEVGRFAHMLGVMVIEMTRKRADLDEVESAVAHHGQRFEDVGFVKASGRDAAGPCVHVDSG